MPGTMNDSVPMTQMELPDYDLGLRGKLLRPGKLAEGSVSTFCTISYGLSLVDDVTDTPFSNVGNGYPDAVVVADEETRVTLPWRPGKTDAVIVDMVADDGTYFLGSPRTVLRRLVADYAERGLEPMLGFEYEMWIFHEDASGEPRRMRSFGRTENAYSLTRGAEIAEIAQEFIDRMEHIDAPVEAFHSELGPGFFEFALMPQPAVRAADGAARARQCLRELCAERGLKASFMAKPFADRSGAGGHVHTSLMADDRNVFATRPGELSSVGAQFVAGLVATMDEFSALFTPYLNSFKRIDPTMFVANRSTWGVDDRSAACRLLLGSQNAARVETRVPGADANPYLVALGVLGAGLVGLQQGLVLGDVAEQDAAPQLPTDLADAARRFSGSKHTRDVLGDVLVDGYTATRLAEVNRYEEWFRHHISDWELDRHWEHQ